MFCTKLWFFILICGFVIAMLVALQLSFHLTAFCGRSSFPILPICNTNLLIMPRNTCTIKISQFLLNLQLVLTDQRAGRHLEFNSSRRFDHSLYIYFRILQICYKIEGMSSINKALKPILISIKIRVLSVSMIVKNNYKSTWLYH